MRSAKKSSEKSKDGLREKLQESVPDETVPKLNKKKAYIGSKKSPAPESTKQNSVARKSLGRWLNKTILSRNNSADIMGKSKSESHVDVGIFRKLVGMSPDRETRGILSDSCGNDEKSSVHSINSTNFSTGACDENDSGVSSYNVSTISDKDERESTLRCSKSESMLSDLTHGPDDEGSGFKSDDELRGCFDKPRGFFEHVDLKSNLIDGGSDSIRLPDLEKCSSSVLLGENLVKETMTVDPKEKTSSERVDHKMTNTTICPEAHINETNRSFRVRGIWSQVRSF